MMHGQKNIKCCLYVQVAWN